MFSMHSSDFWRDLAGGLALTVLIVALLHLPLLA
jgi:hypothetical protein